jgi:uncharacterized membrane protein YfcA
MMDLSLLPIIFALVATGIIAGILAGLLGVGGGIVIVPVLFIIFQILGLSTASAMSIATGTSLLIIVATSISSIRSHHKKSNADIELLALWSPFIVFGVIMGALISTQIGGLFASGVFGVVAILVALNMLFRARKAALWSSLPSKFIQGTLATIVGTISVVMGIGGGTLGVPLLTAFNYPTHKAVGTSAAFGFIISVPGTLLMFLLANTPDDAAAGTYGFINFIAVALIMPLSVIAAPVGVYLGSKIDDVMLKRLFAVFLCLSGSRMVYQSLF